MEYSTSTSLAGDCGRLVVGGAASGGYEFISQTDRCLILASRATRCARFPNESSEVVEHLTTLL